MNAGDRVTELLTHLSPRGDKQLICSFTVRSKLKTKNKKMIYCYMPKPEISLQYFKSKSVMFGTKLYNTRFVFDANTYAFNWMLFEYDLNSEGRRGNQI